MKINVIKRAKEVLDIEACAIIELKKNIGKDFIRALEIILKSKGRVVVSGMGKTGIIAQKSSATLASTGTPSLFLHTAEAIHGDLGKVTSDDAVIILSNSGAGDEIRQLVPLLKKIGAKIIALTGNTKSILAKYSDIILDISVKKEACPLGLAPTTSTTATLAMGDALAISLLYARGFTREDFANFHPGGSLGQQLLLRVSDIMHQGVELPQVADTVPITEALVEMSSKGLGMTAVLSHGLLVGIFTDGDLRRTVDLQHD